jgi:uncharacterized protein YndB with AHSA1/START domain
MTAAAQATATQIYQVFIKATPEQIWEAITTPEFTAKYFHGARIQLIGDRYLSRGPDGSVWGDAPVLESDPPRRLVHGWQSLYNEDLAEEPMSRVSWEIEPGENGVCKLTVIHDQLERSPLTARNVSGGWMFIVSSLKTLLETGEPL